MSLGFKSQSVGVRANLCDGGHLEHVL